VATGASGDKIGVSSSDPSFPYKLYSQEGDSLAGIPTIWIIFTVTQDEVVIVAAKVASMPTDEDS